ncbi:MAG: N-acetyl-gamma-glutamyl-phosphate reductase [Clostridia bacterium]|nr:N-acetyl-gamma-glutamyl-phosphate reductase [Clostridia bacterium]
MKKRIFIDGSAGTTGLDIFRRISGREDIELITLPEEQRKDVQARKVALNSADIAFLCLPDAAAIESAALVENDRTVLLDTSTAHRTDDAWAYGFPELSEKHFEKIRNSKRIAVPGCHASGFIALVYPLIESGLLANDAKLTCFSLTGYSGGGKKMIAEYEGEGRDILLGAPRQYALSQKHKHLPEMQKIAGLSTAPAFCPIVADFYSDMEVTIPLFAGDVNGTAEDIKKVYAEKYTGDIVKYAECSDEEGFASAAKKSGTDAMEVSVFGNEERILLVARYDNLGKGACGAAIECLNIVMGAELAEGMNI